MRKAVLMRHAHYKDFPKRCLVIEQAQAQK